MALNLASLELGCTVSHCTSTCDGCPAENALMDDVDRIWLSADGKSSQIAAASGNGSASLRSLPVTSRGSPPQSVTIDMSQIALAQPSTVINTAGIYCWHAYSSNPKVISVFTSQGEMHNIDKSPNQHSRALKDESIVDILSKGEESYILAGRAVLNDSPKAGLMLFSLDTPIKLKNTRLVRFVFEEAFGSEQVYVNRLHLYESTPDVVRLFVDDYNNMVEALDAANTRSQGSGTPATKESGSMRIDERIDSSLEKLHESMVLQYVPETEDAFGRSISDTDSLGPHSAGLSQGRWLPNSHAGRGNVGLHVNQSGSVDIHVPSADIHGNGTNIRISRSQVSDGKSKTSQIEESSVLSLSPWEIRQAVRKPLSHQLKSMCEKVAQLADARGITDHGLSAANEENTSHKLEKRSKVPSKIPHKDKEKSINFEEGTKSGPQDLSTLLESMGTCISHANALEARVASCENEIISLRRMMRKMLASNPNIQDETIRRFHQDGTANSSSSMSFQSLLEKTPEHVDNNKKLRSEVMSILSHWERDMVTSVFEPHLKSMIESFEKKVDERIMRLHRGAPSLREAPRRGLSWVVGGDLPTANAQVPRTIDKVALEQEVLVRRLKEKMKAKTETLKAIQRLQNSPVKPKPSKNGKLASSDSEQERFDPRVSISSTGYKGK